MLGRKSDALKTGDVAIWLLKPVHYPLYLLAIEAGASAYTFLLAVVPTIVIVALIAGLTIGALIKRRTARLAEGGDLSS